MFPSEKELPLTQKVDLWGDLSNNLRFTQKANLLQSFKQFTLNVSGILYFWLDLLLTVYAFKTTNGVICNEFETNLKSVLF